jgi:fucose permease
MSGDGTASDNTHKKRLLGIALLVGCIFFGSCAENVMSNWVSSFAENALGLDKTTGDIFGMAMFAILLGLARISYAKFGKNISRILVIGMTGAFFCYIVAALTGRYTAFIACALTGLFTSMLWPGALILMEEKIEGASVTAFALMAAGGDMGAALAPQLMGIIIDKVSLTNWAYSLGEKLNLTAEQIGLKTGMLVSSIFPLIGVFVLIFTIRYFKKKD